MNLEHAFKKIENLIQTSEKLTCSSEGSANLFVTQLRIFAQIEALGRTIEDELARKAAAGEDITAHGIRYARLIRGNEAFVLSRIICCAQRMQLHSVAV